MHQVYKTAQRVVDNAGDFPLCVVTLAQDLLTMNDERRNQFAMIANNRHLWRAWLSAKKWAKENKANHPTTRLEHLTSSRLYRLLGADSNKLHAAKIRLRDHRAHASWYKVFLSMVQLVESQEIELIHRYLECVNAKRTDLTLGPVTFIRWVEWPQMAEILAWKLARK